MINVTNLSEEEIKALCSLDPDLGGIFLSFIVYTTHYNAFSIIETVVTPLVTDTKALYTTSLTYDQSFAFTVFAFVGCFTFIVFFAFSWFFGLYRFRKFSDTTIVLFSLVMGAMGSLMLIDFQSGYLNVGLVMIGLCFLSFSFFLGRVATNNMYSKIIGM